MKSKRKMLIALVLLIISSLSLIGCTSREEDVEIDEDEVVNAEQFVSDFLTAYQEKDPNAGAFLTTSAFGESDMIFEGFQSYLAETLTYTIVGWRVDEHDPELIWVDTKIENVDFAEILLELEDTDETDSDLILEMVIELIRSPNAPRRVFEVSIIVIEFPTEMLIELDGELSDALLGGFPTFIAEGLE